MQEQQTEEERWDEKLHIRTAGRDDAAEDAHHYPYEPTPYAVLQKVADAGWVTQDDVLFDLGCGKGRVSLFLAAVTGCRCIGIDFLESFVEEARKNAADAGLEEAVRFACERAEACTVPAEVTAVFLFNPFSVTILKAALARLSASWYEAPRRMKVMAYYPSEDYVAALMQEDWLTFDDELDCADLFPGDVRERVLCFVAEEI